VILINGAPVTHADVSAECRKIDVLPLSAVAVPLDERLTSKSSSVSDVPGTHDAFEQAPNVFILDGSELSAGCESGGKRGWPWGCDERLLPEQV
jgi:hypothetical protein